jgi:hypothetical protein
VRPDVFEIHASEKLRNFLLYPEESLLEAENQLTAVGQYGTKDSRGVILIDAKVTRT